MSVVDAMGQQQLDSGEQGRTGLPLEPRLPAGKPLRTVQPLPLPLPATSVRPADEPRPVLDEQAKHREVAMNRAGITGTGVIVDTIA